MDVDVRRSTIPEAGRGLFADKTFQPGDVILSLNRPYVGELEIARLQDTCAWCFVGDEYANVLTAVSDDLLENEESDLKACTGCRKVKYCSKACQTKAWKREHKYECKIISKSSTPDLPHGVRAVIKLLGRLKADPDKVDQKLLDTSRFKPGADDASLEVFKQRDPKSFEEFNMLAYGAWKYAGSPDLGKKDSEILAKCFFFNIMCSSFTLTSPLRDNEPLGIAFDPILCTANHSCDPNSFVVSNQPQIQLRALRPIKKDEELTLSYLGAEATTDPFSIRQKSLRETYNFPCRCPKCRKGANMSSREDGFLQSPETLLSASSSSPLTTQADALTLRHKSILSEFFLPSPDELTQRRLAALQAEVFSVASAASSTEDSILSALNLCLSSGLWSMTRQPIPRLLRRLLSLYLSSLSSSNDHYRAWRLASKLHVEILPELYPSSSSSSSSPFHPERIAHALLMVKLTNALCQPEHAEVVGEILKQGLDLRVLMFGFAKELREGVKGCYGEESAMGQVGGMVYGIFERRGEVGEMEKRWEGMREKYWEWGRGVDVLSL